MVRQVQRHTLSETVTEALRAMILEGELRSGQRVTQGELAQHLGVSTMPVRAALTTLVQEGFVVPVRSGGYEVTHRSRNDIADIYWVHGLVAGELTRRATLRATDDLVAALLSAQGDLERAIKNGDTQQMELANWEFHRRLNFAAAAPQLTLVLKSLLRFIPLHFYTRVRAWRSEALDGHAAILEAVRRKEPDVAKQAAQHHVERAGELLIAYFDEAGYWQNPTQTAGALSQS